MLLLLPRLVLVLLAVQGTFGGPPTTAQEHLAVFWDFQEPSPPYANTAPGQASGDHGCDLTPYHYTNDTNDGRSPQLPPAPGANGMINRTSDGPGIFGNYSAHLHGDPNGTGAMLSVPRATCPGAYISGPNATLSMVLWFKHTATDPVFEGHGRSDSFGHGAGVWNEDEDNRQYVIYPRNSRAYPYAHKARPVGPFLDVEVSAIGGNTPRRQHSITFALGNTTIPDEEWLCLGMTYDGRTIGAYVNGLLDVRPPTHVSTTGTEETWENPYDMSEAYPGAPGGVFSGTGTFSVGGKAGPVTRGQREGLPGLYHGVALYSVALTMNEMIHVCQGH
jgi:hypothetical protein